MGVIYSILNKVNNKRYIGSAINFRHRKTIHLRQLKNNNHHSKPLQRAWNKYGEESFSFIILENVDDNFKLIEREQWWLDNTPNEYNSCKVAGSTLGFKHTDESKKKMRLASLGLKHPEWRNKLKSESQGGDKHWTKSKSFSEKSRKKMSDSQKQIFATGFHPRNKKIAQYSLDDIFIKEFNSVKEAAEFYGFKSPALRNCAGGKSKISYGYKWKYIK